MCAISHTIIKSSVYCAVSSSVFLYTHSLLDRKTARNCIVTSCGDIEVMLKCPRFKMWLVTSMVKLAAVSKAIQIIFWLLSFLGPFLVNMHHTRPVVMLIKTVFINLNKIY